MEPMLPETPPVSKPTAALTPEYPLHYRNVNQILSRATVAMMVLGVKLLPQESLAMCVSPHVRRVVGEMSLHFLAKQLALAQ